MDAEKTATLNQLKADKTELEGKIAATNKAIEDAKAADTASEKAITDQIAALEAELEKADADNKKAIEDQIAALNNDLKAADAELKGYIENLENAAADLQSQIDDTNTALAALESDLEGQITTSEQKVLNELNTVKTAIEGQLATINNTIATLQAKDQELDQKILDLKNYVDSGITSTTDWANATFSTLEQYEATQTAISQINALIKSTQESIVALEENLNKKITDDIAAAIEAAIKTSENSMMEWVNGVLADGYYTKAEIDGKITALQTQVAEGDAALQKEIDDLEAALEKAEADLTTAYQKAITDAVADGGIINEAIQAVTETYSATAFRYFNLKF